MVLDSGELHKCAYFYSVFLMPILPKLIRSEINYRSRVESGDFSAGHTLSCRQAISFALFSVEIVKQKLLVLNDKHFTSNTSNLFNLLRLSGATCFDLQRPSSGPFANRVFVKTRFANGPEDGLCRPKHVAPLNLSKLNKLDVLDVKCFPYFPLFRSQSKILL